MAKLYEALLVGNIDQAEQVTIVNATGAALSPDEVFYKTTAQSETIAHVAQASIAISGTGEALVKGECDFKAKTTATFAVGDDIYWHASANEAIVSSAAQTGDFYVAMCTLAKASGAKFVRGRLNEQYGAVAPSASASTSSSSRSTSISSNSDSSSCVSVASVSVSSNSDSSVSIP